MLSIVGNIKINDSARLKYLKATLWSFEFIKDCQLLLNIDCDCETLDEITKEVRKLGFKNFEISNKNGNYGEIYCELLEKVNSDFVLNYIEDKFYVLDNRDKLAIVLKAMKLNKVDICKDSFFKIEQNSSKELFSHYDSSYGIIFENNKTNHNLYQKYYGSRFFVGVNFITTLEFAKKFWSRKINTNRPHEYEIAKYNPEFEHRCMITNFELGASCDDNHGELGTCLLERKDEKKFWNIYNKV
jgi:hypothetical protein